MKFIVNTKSLAKMLNKIPDGDRVVRCRYIDRVFKIETSGGLLIELNISDAEMMATFWFHHEHRRWDWVKHTVLSVSECPVVVEIGDNKLNLIFSY